MTASELRMRFDFLIEKRLHSTDENLHSLFRNSVFSVDRLLANYKTVFPFFTDHTFEHSAQVINYCNIIAGDAIIDTLDPDELYILLMGATLHDVGMGISEADFGSLCGDVLGLDEYMNEHPGEPTAEYTREFHEEFSALFIKKYSPLFEIPSPEHTHCIAQVARDHRKADLLDTGEYPTDYTLPNGRRVNLAYLAALVKFADELDVTSDRNLLFDYRTVNKKWNAKQMMCFKTHGAIKQLVVREDALVLLYDTDEKPVEDEILRSCCKVNQTFEEYREVVAKRTDHRNRISKVIFEKI